MLGKGHETGIRLLSFTQFQEILDSKGEVTLPDCIRLTELELTFKRLRKTSNTFFFCFETELNVKLVEGMVNSRQNTAR